MGKKQKWIAESDAKTKPCVDPLTACASRASNPHQACLLPCHRFKTQPKVRYRTSAKRQNASCHQVTEPL
jgi:hypothetical protein